MKRYETELEVGDVIQIGEHRVCVAAITDNEATFEICSPEDDEAGAPPRRQPPKK